MARTFTSPPSAVPFPSGTIPGTSVTPRRSPQRPSAPTLSPREARARRSEGPRHSAHLSFELTTRNQTKIGSRRDFDCCSDDLNSSRIVIHLTQGFLPSFARFCLPATSKCWPAPAPWPQRRRVRRRTRLGELGETCGRRYPTVAYAYVSRALRPVGSALHDSVDSRLWDRT